MTLWMSRPQEERALLNPAFCSCLLWHAAMGYTSIAKKPLPFDLSFLVLPMVLHRDTREALPSSVATSLAVWLEQNPLSRSRIADSAQKLVPFTKEAMMFGGVHQLLDLQGCVIAANSTWRKPIISDLNDSTEEVRACAKRAEFVGRWFAKTGSSMTIMTLLGVKP